MKFVDTSKSTVTFMSVEGKEEFIEPFMKLGILEEKPNSSPLGLKVVGEPLKVLSYDEGQKLCNEHFELRIQFDYEDEDGNVGTLAKSEPA